MNKIIKIFSLTLIILYPLFGEGKISGYMFGDFFYVLTHHDTLIKGQNGFWFRRIYFTYDYDISEGFSSRLRFEMNSSGDFKSSDLLIPYIKDAYLKYKLNYFDLFLGISPTPTWEIVEEHYGYRFLEKTPVDLQKMGSARDFGIGIKGKFVEGKVRLHLLFGNGEGVKSEFNKQKAIYSSLSFYFGKFIMELYGDFYDALDKAKRFNTLQVFSGFKNEKMKTAFLFVNQKRENKDYTIGSGYFIFNMSEKFSFLIRYDKMFEKNPQGDKISYIPFSKDAPSNLFIAGIDFKPHKDINFMPNIKYVFYDEENGIKPDADLYLNLTFFYNFK